MSNGSCYITKRAGMSAGIKCRSQLLLLLPSCQNSVPSPLTSTGSGGNSSPHLNTYLYYHLLPFIHSQCCFIQMKIISWQCCCPQTNPTDGCPLWPQRQELNSPFVSSLGFSTAHTLVKYSVMRLQKETSENITQTVSCLLPSEAVL